MEVNYPTLISHNIVIFKLKHTVNIYLFIKNKTNFYKLKYYLDNSLDLTYNKLLITFLGTTFNTYEYTYCVFF